MSDRGTVRYGGDVGKEIADHRRPRVGVLRLLLVSLLTVSLLAGCVRGVDPQPEVTAADEFPPTSTELIAEALDAGEIDAPTSWLYRTWLYFGDPKLPAEFIGEDAPYELGLIAQLRNKLDEMPEEIQAQIEPYLLRPDDPRSAFNAPAAGNQNASPVAFVKETAPVADKKFPPHRCDTSWLTVAVVGLPFRVWVCDDSAALAGFTPDEALDFVSDMLIEYAPQMIADMGELIPDDPDQQSGEIRDDLIDVYALPTGWLSPYRENYDTAPPYARTVQSPPNVGNTTSSYVLVSLEHSGDQPLLERMLVHELFHAFHNTFNAKLDAPWWTEGVAEWAASYYVRSDSERLYQVRMKYLMDIAAPSILLEGELTKYAAYIWPLFMEQEVGAEAVFDSVRALATLPAGADTEAVIAVLDQQLPMSANYPELAVRLVNMQYPGDPISPKFQDLDAHFPAQRPPRMDEFTLGKEPVELNANAMYGLGYRDYYVAVEPPPDHPPGTGVLVRVSGQVATGSGLAPVLQALVRDPDGEYSRVRLAYNGDGDSVCVDEEMVLVLANNSTEKLDLTEGTLVLQRLDGEPCSRIEVNDPEYFYALSEGDTVHVDGIEGDDEPDDTRLVVTVRDPDPSEIDEYEVKVRVTGGTLRTPRSFSWPLSSLENPGEGVWQQDVPLPLDIDLTDENRPLTIDARLERSGKGVDSNSPTVILQGDQEPRCFTDVDITGTVMHQIYYEGGSEYRPYPVSMSGRFEHPTGVTLVTLSDYANTMLQMQSLAYDDPDPFDKDSIHFVIDSFGLDVPSGGTRSYVLESSLAYYDYTNIPWAKLDEGTDLPNQGRGQPLPGDVPSMLRGNATLDVTKNLPSAGILEGTITGVFTDEYAYNHGDRLEVTLTFATANQC